MIDGNTPVWQLTVDQLKELIHSTVVTQPKPEVVEDAYFSSEQARVYMGVSKSTIARWKKDKYLKSEKLGGILRYRKSECDKVLNQSE